MFRVVIDRPFVGRHLSGPSSRLTLREVLHRTGPLPQELALRIARRLALALAERHAAGQVHGAVTLDHVLVSDGDEPRSVRILDAAAVSANTTSKHCPSTSPEQAAGGDPVLESDLYALGAIVFYMLTGQSIFQGSPWEVAWRHRFEAPPSVAGLAPHAVSPALDTLVRQCLAKAPADRRLKAAELAAAFAAIPAVEGHRVVEAPLRGGTPANRWGRPRPQEAAPAPHLRRPPATQPASPQRRGRASRDTTPTMRAVKLAGGG